MTVSKKLLAASVVVLGVSAAPVIPAPNGLISVAVCDTSQGEVHVQVPDALYKRMGESGGYAHNPTVQDPQTSEAIKCNSAYQYLSSFQIPAPPRSYVSTTTGQLVTPKEDRTLKWRRSFKDDDKTNAFQMFFASVANAAIATDAFTTKAGSSGITSLTWSHTISGSDRALFVFAAQQDADTGEEISGMTYNGTAMTQLSKQQRAAPDNTAWTYVYYIAAPDTGANNVVVSVTSSSFIGNGIGASYTGAQQTGIPDSTNTGSVHSTALTVSTTVVDSNAWLVCFGYDDNGGTTLSGDVTTSRASQADLGGVLYDSNATVTSGSKDCTVSGNNGNRGAHVFSFITAAAAASDQQQVILFE